MTEGLLASIVGGFMVVLIGVIVATRRPKP
jgi:uncharacterized membrane protein